MGSGLRRLPFFGGGVGGASIMGTSVRPSLDLIWMLKSTLLLWFLDEIVLTPPLLYSPLSDSTEHHVPPPVSQLSAPLGGPGRACFWPLAPGPPLVPPRGPPPGEAEAAAEGPEGGAGWPPLCLAPPGEKTGREGRQEEGSSDLHRWRSPSCESGERRLRIPLWEETMERLETEQAASSRVRGGAPPLLLTRSHC